MLGRRRERLYIVVAKEPVDLLPYLPRGAAVVEQWLTPLARGTVVASRRKPPDDPERGVEFRRVDAHPFEGAFDNLRMAFYVRGSVLRIRAITEYARRYASRATIVLQLSVARSDGHYTFTCRVAASNLAVARSVARAVAADLRGAVALGGVPGLISCIRRRGRCGPTSAAEEAKALVVLPFAESAAVNLKIPEAVEKKLLGFYDTAKARRLVRAAIRAAVRDSRRAG